MKKIIFFLLVFSISQLNAWSVGDQVYAIFGSGSSARVESGTIVVFGESRSKVEWNYCSNCNPWSYNSDFYYSYSSAKEYADKLDSEHTSIGEAAGTVAAAGIIWAILEEMD